MNFHQLYIFVSQFCKRFCFLWIQLLLQLLCRVTFLEVVFKVASPISVAVSNNPYLLDKFITNDKNPYLLTFSCSWFQRITCHFYLSTSNIKLTLSSISNDLLYWSINVMIISLNLVIQVFKNTKLISPAFNR